MISHFLGCTRGKDESIIPVWNDLCFCFLSFHRLKHRGPDWSGLYQHGDCYLAHQRLAIIDPASGDQPLFNEDKSIVVTVCAFCLSLS